MFLNSWLTSVVRSCRVRRIRGKQSKWRRSHVAARSSVESLEDRTLLTTLAPTMLDLVAAHDTGDSSSDNITSVTEPAILGSAEADSTIQLFVNGIERGTTTTNGGGIFILTIDSGISDGLFNITATANNGTGESVHSSPPLSITIDTIEPDAPAALDLDAASDSGTADDDDLTNDSTPTITGTAEAGTTVELLDGTTSLGTATADGSGDWTIDSSELTDGVHQLTVTSTDVAGNESAASALLAVTVDSTSPAAPSTPDLDALTDTGDDTDNITSITTPTINGTAEADSAIELFDGATSLGTTTADGSGNWSIDSSELADGVHQLTVTATDDAGNVSSPSAALQVTIDSTTPDAPVSLALDPASDTGTADDDLTGDTTPTINGTAEAGSKVELFDGVSPLGDTTADGSGNWTIVPTVLAEGVHTLEAQSTDTAGNASVVSTALSITIDTTAPDAPAAPDLDAASDSGDLDTDDITLFTTPTINGTAEPGSTVELLEGILSLGTSLADGSGNWTIVSPPLSEGVHSLVVRQTDAAGNGPGPNSDSLVLTIDITAPDAPAAPDLDTASDSGTAVDDDLTNDATPTINGTAEAGSTVELLDGSTSLGTAVTDGLGDWTLDSSELTDGIYELTVTATDAAGNTGLDSVSLTITVDKTAPDVPPTPNLQAFSDSGDSNEDDITDDTTPSISGTAEAGSTVTLLHGAIELGEATADGSGNWSIDSSELLDDVYQLTVTATDAAGNLSAASTALQVEIDTTAPDAPAALDLDAASDSGTLDDDDLTNDTTPIINGTAEAGSKVELFDGVEPLGDTTADGSGNWSIETVTLSDGIHSLVAQAIDVAGNRSADSLPISVTIDTTAPGVPATLDLDPASDSGGDNADHITNDDTPAIKGTADAGATVTLHEGATSLGTQVADGSGDWSITSDTLADGSHSLTATATDAAGNSSAASAAVIVDVDTEAPTTSLQALVTNDNSPLLQGAVDDISATVQVQVDGQDLSANNNHDGTWSLAAGELSALADAIYDVVVTATDVAGNSSIDSSINDLEIDTVAPDAPAALDLDVASDSGTADDDDVTSDTTPTIHGTAEAGSAVELLDGSTSLGNATTDGSGNWTIVATPLPDGNHSLTVQATDAAENTSTLSSSLDITIDTTAPDAPTALDLDVAGDSGISDIDNITSVTTPTIHGTAEAGSKVELFDGVSPLGDTTADGSGNWTIDSSELADGVHQLIVTATDAAGNQGNSSVALPIVVDTLPPDITIDALVSNLASPGLSGSIDDDFASIVVTVESEGHVATNDQDGTWSVAAGELTDLAEGIYDIAVTATDLAGNATTLNEPTVLEIDTTSPGIPLSLDLAAPSDTGDSHDDDLTRLSDVVISGEGDPDSQVNVYSSLQGLVGTGTVPAAFPIWTIVVSSLIDGSHELRATASDDAGNVSDPSGVLAVTIDTVPPVTPALPDLESGSDSGTDDDNITSSTTPTFNGTAEIGSTVELLDGSTSLGNATTDGSGNWTIGSGVLADGDYQLTVTATDVAGNLSSPSSLLQVTIDTTAPAAPGVPELDSASDSGVLGDNITSNSTPAIGGTAEPGSTVELFEGVTFLDDTIADGSGNWTILSPTLSQGPHSLVVRQTDIAGNGPGPDSDPLVLTIDNAAPAAPALLVLDAASDSGTADDDNLTNDATPTINGTAEVGSTVELLDGTNPLGTATTDGSGNWTINSSQLADGVHQLTATATDAAGNLSAESTALVVDIDTTAPDAPAAPDLALSSDSGNLQDDDITNAASLTFAGVAEAGSEVELFVGVTFLDDATADEISGVWSVTTTALAQGVHQLTVTATDAADNLSAASTALQVEIDTTAPDAPAALDLDAASDSGTADDDHLTNDTTPTIHGTAEANSTVELFDGATPLGNATADGSGNWTIDSSELTDGVNQLTATATDAAGNLSAASTALQVEIDTTAPDAPAALDLDAASDSGDSDTDNITAVTTPTIHGTAEAGSTVKLLHGAIELGETTADGSGNWTIESSELADGVHQLTATATDAADNLSAASTALEVVIDLSTMLIEADVFATAAGNQVFLVLDGDQLRAVDQSHNDLIESRLASEIQAVEIDGRPDSDDSLVVTLEALPSGGLSFSGGGGSGSDHLAITSDVAGSANTLDVTLSDTTSGIVTADDIPITFSGIGSVDTSGISVTGSHSVEFSNADDTIVLSTSSVSNGFFAYAPSLMTSLAVSGGEGNDHLVGSQLGDQLAGGAGDDTLNGGGGDDLLDGNAGDDRLMGGGGVDTVNGGDGNDLLKGQGGVLNVLTGGADLDTIKESTDSDFFLDDVSLKSEVSTHILDGIELAVLRGNNADNTLDASGFSGQTTLIGLSGNDLLVGGNGDDVVRGNNGDDTILGLGGNDRVLAGSGNDGIAGGSGNDTLNGNGGSDSIFGGLGDDTLLGGAGADTLLGEDGDDSVNGNGGGDTVAGGDGSDSIADLTNEIDEAFELIVDWIDES